MTLEVIEQRSWGDAPADASYLVRTVHRLRRKPIGELEVEDLRILLGQDVGTVVVLPYALTVLEQNPFAEGDYYPGDLLSTVLSLPLECWQGKPVGSDRIGRIVSAVESMDPEASEDLDDTMLSKIRDFRMRRSQP
ncbi:contact-dependent growth inhibition system immunity protein [Amycolatopsis sp. NBC_00345]|uniref:contact-dependent growth inhibition system immunity protein n=1 Tax=Amycolatopsis sp. NBC_00345 TaxID=2975955 RepID=UPI002E265EF4